MKRNPSFGMEIVIRLLYFLAQNLGNVGGKVDGWTRIVKRLWPNKVALAGPGYLRENFHTDSVNIMENN